MLTPTLTCTDPQMHSRCMDLTWIWTHDERLGEAANPGPHLQPGTEYEAHVWSAQLEAERQFLEHMEGTPQTGPWTSPPRHWPRTPHFVKCDSFEGARHNAYFGTGPLGLGYYADSDHDRHQRHLARTRLAEAARDCSMDYLRLPDHAPDVVAAPPAQSPSRRRRGRRPFRGAPAATPPADALCYAATPPARRDGYWTFDSINANCAASALWYLARTAADACMLQETRVAGEARRTPGADSVLVHPERSLSAPISLN